MNETVQLLQDVVRNARTGQDAVEHLMQKTEEGRMREELIREKEDYAVTRRESEQALVNAGGRAEPVGPLAKAGMWAGLEMETLADRSDAHIAEIVIQGATMGVIEMTKALNSYDGADAGARDLASRFVVQQNETIDRQKVFLT
ncbi:MAG: hypothetical protein IKF98_01810 [Clostridia bacterium]|nr:hypothetical protein [Clostridia bacterium]